MTFPHTTTYRITTAKGIATAVVSGNIVPPAGGATYDDKVAIFDADLTSYWKLASGGTDQKGVENAVITGSPTYGPTIVGLDVGGTCADWPGAGAVYAEVPHNPAHKTAAGTIVVSFQIDSLTTKSALVQCNDSEIATPSEFAMEVRSDGIPFAYLHTSTGAASLLGSQALALNNAYTMVFKWGTGGLSMAVYDENQALVGARQTNATTEGIGANVSAIRFAQWHSGGLSPHDGPLGRVIWLDRRISDAEELELARPKTIAVAPVAVADSVTMPANSQTTLDVLANDTFSGPRTGVTINLQNIPPGWTIVPDGTPNNDLSITTPVGATSQQFDYSITVGGLTSSVVPVPVTVSTGVAPRHINEFGLTDPNNPTNVRSAFAAAITWASANGTPSMPGIIELSQGQVYQMLAASNGSKDRPNGAIQFLASTPNVWIRTQGSPSRASGNQAVLRHVGWTTQGWNSGNQVFQRCIVLFKSAVNCHLSHVTVDGNRLSCGTTWADRMAFLQNPSAINWVGTGDNGGLHVVAVRGSTNCSVKESKLLNAMTDCFQIDMNHDNNENTTGFLLEDTNCDFGRRAGIGQISGGLKTLTWDQNIFRRCTGNDTGDMGSSSSSPQSQAMPGEPPAAGSDMEPNQPITTDWVWGTTYDTCQLLRNGGFSIELGTPKTGGGQDLMSDIGGQGKGNGSLRYMKVLTCTIGGSSRSTNFFLRTGTQGQSTMEDILCEGNTISGAGNLTLRFEGQTNTGRLVNVVLINNNTPKIELAALSTVGGTHSVTIWRGSYNPTITTGGISNVTINNGFPP